MKGYSALMVLICILAGCGREEIRPALVVECLLRMDSQEATVFVGIATGEEVVPVADAIVSLRQGAQTYPCELDDGRYRTSGFSGIQPGQEWQLEVIWGEEQARGTTIVPEAVTSLHSDVYMAVIDPASSGTELFELTWDAVPGIEYVLELGALDPTAGELVLAAPAGQFVARFGRPFPEATAVLKDTDFVRYGAQRITVLGIDESLRDLFFFSSTGENGLLQSGPDNITGGRGWFGALSADTVNVELLP